MQWDSIALRSFITKTEHHWAKWNRRCRFLFFVKMCHLVNAHVNYSTLQNSKKSQLWLCVNFYSSWTLLDTCFLLVSYSIAEEKCSSTFIHNVFQLTVCKPCLLKFSSITVGQNSSNGCTSTQTFDSDIFLCSRRLSIALGKMGKQNAAYPSRYFSVLSIANPCVC